MRSFEPERILLIGDRDRGVHAALAQVLPGAEVVVVPNYFDAIAELSGQASSGAGEKYTTVLAAAEPIERRPEAAMKTLRDLAGDGRVLLFGHPTLEPLSRKMLDFGCDDYVITPVSPGEIQQMFGAPPLRLTPAPATESTDANGENASEPVASQAPGRVAILSELPMAEIVLDAMLQHPHDATEAAIKQVNARLTPTLRLMRTKANQSPPTAPEGMQVLSHALRHESGPAGALHLALPRDEDETAARHALAQLSHLVGKLLSLGERHNRLQKLAITDDLTGVYNGRYFRHMLRTLLEQAREKRFTVTLLLFDIDNFKSYNDRYGHGVGDEILMQTAALMKKCCRAHDLVARISGDEFAVVFWEKEGPRQPRPRDSVVADEANSPVTPTSRVPQSVRAVCDRFRRLISSPDFGVLGTTGQGTLTISGGLAVYPFDASTSEDLIDAADRALMFDAKKGGKNTIFLVGTGDGGFSS